MADPGIVPDLGDRARMWARTRVVETFVAAVLAGAWDDDPAALAGIDLGMLRVPGRSDLAVVASIAIEQAATPQARLALLDRSAVGWGDVLARDGWCRWAHGCPGAWVRELPRLLRRWGDPDDDAREHATWTALALETASRLALRTPGWDLAVRLVGDALDPAGRSRLFALARRFLRDGEARVAYASALWRGFPGWVIDLLGWIAGNAQRAPGRAISESRGENPTGGEIARGRTVSANHSANQADRAGRSRP